MSGVFFNHIALEGSSWGREEGSLRSTEQDPQSREASVWHCPGNGFKTRVCSEEASDDGQEPEHHRWELSYGDFSLV